MSTSRVPPIPPREWPEGMAEALAAAYRPSNPRHPVPPRDPASPKGLNAMGVLAHHPELTAAYNQLIRHALYFTTITPRQRELLVLRVAHRRGAAYEWAQHVYQAGVAGLTPEEVARVRIGPDAPEWSVFERTLLSAADELVADARIGERTYSALAADFDTQQMMDVVFTVGAYEVFAMAMRTFDVELDDDLQPYA
ncbi:MAG TPA: carboxymuconolactone decarboxylase family protein [Acidimicrobiales bacterium]|jgi:alkylhydroperoxidase family enzyme|nr:carboxymuconolactone decarboxylase family protein [Acidimicrobiales bacterium]